MRQGQLWKKFQYMENSDMQENIINKTEFRKKEYYVFAFNSSHVAISAEKILKNLGAMMMPTPRSISASCGMSLKISGERIEEAQKTIEESNIAKEMYTIHKIEE